MTIPYSIPFSSVSLGERGRKKYTGIEELAEQISTIGLIEPIVLTQDLGHLQDSPTYTINGGGRRYTALASLGCETLYHATTSDPLRPGFVLKGPDESTPLKNLLSEIAENQNRQDLDWRDELPLIVKAYRLASAEDESLIMATWGASIGVHYNDLRAAVSIYDDFLAFPEAYAACSNVRSAYSVKLKRVADEIQSLRSKAIAKVQVQKEPEPGEAPATPSVPVVEIALDYSVRHCNGLDFLNNSRSESIDHIITDPDYGVSIERLEANSSNMSSGVAQSQLEQTLEEFGLFFTHAFRVLKSSGYLVFFYDLDHHEKLSSLAASAGFRVQRWPLTWVKSGACSNAAPNHNFPKTTEWAMVCAKPGATLAKVQNTSVFTCAPGDITKILDHPFAKPIALWQWIFSAICHPEQVVLDPFAGRGSMPIAAIRHGLRPIACEVQEAHFHNLKINIRTEWEKRHERVKFI